MITFQKQIAYAGEVTNSPLRSVNIVFQVPIFEYTAVGTEGQEVVRRTTSSKQEGSVSQALDGKSYSIVLDDQFITSRDGQSLALSKQYYTSALKSGAVDDLIVNTLVRYLSSDDQELGTQSFDFICLPKLEPTTDRLSTRAASLRPKISFVAVNRVGFDKLRKQLSTPALAIDDALLLQAISILTTLDGSTPMFQESAIPESKRLFETQASRTADVLKAIKSAFSDLYDFPLTIPEISTLKIAGRLTIVAPAGTDISARDFLDYELSAESTQSNGSPLFFAYRFDDQVRVTDNAAAFDLTVQKSVYRNALRRPVVFRVRGIDGSIEWSREFPTDDPALAEINAEVRLQRPTILTRLPKDAEPDQTKKLRGRVLTFNKECSLKDTLVLIVAKDAPGWIESETITDVPLGREAKFRVVGAAITDTAGNFSIPYPYGTYSEAEAVVSLAPSEMVSIPIVANEGDATISDDFLYLLINDPKCPAPATREDCDCGTDKPNRLPDFSDLIESDAYTQDIGGSCINLSKPNRTISEFNYRAIVRTSDPSVANYTLIKIETGVESIDVSLTVALKNAASLISSAASSSMSAATNNSEAAGRRYFLEAMKSLMPHVATIRDALSLEPITFSVLVTTFNHVESVLTLLESAKTYLEAEYTGSLRDLLTDASFPNEGIKLIDAARNLKGLVNLAIDTVGTSARYELIGGSQTQIRESIGLNNPVTWQDAPDAKQLETLSQAVTVATGHILHYKALFKADGYSLGDLLYSLPLAPGQKKEIVVFEASRTLAGAESQSLSQNERLAMGLVNEREITNQLAGSISETLRGSSSANTSGISAGFGTGGQGYGSSGAYGGSGSAVLGIAGGVSNANSNARQDSSRDVAEFFGEKLRQSIMQNAEGYRQLNASLVTTVQESQRYGVTSEVVANHNHCHALTMLYFEVLRHFAVFQKLSSVEECVFVPFLLTKFSTENVVKWSDVLAPALLPMPSDTYLQPFMAMAGPGRQHPLVKAFDANQRIKTHYANVDFPEAAYDDEPIRFLKGEMRLRVKLPRPKTRYDRILSLPITTQTTTTSNTTGALAGGAAGALIGSVLGSLIPGIGPFLGAIAGGAAGGAAGADTTTTVTLVKQQIFDSFMQIDANFQTVPPAQCIRVKSFQPTSFTFGALILPISGVANFFDKDPIDERRWTAYATLLGYSNVLDMLDNYFAGRLIAEWEQIFNKDIAPIIFDKVVDSIRFSEFNADFTSEQSYEGGERRMQLFFNGTTTRKRNQLPPRLRMIVSSADVKALKSMVTLNVETLRISYSTSHYNGLLYSSNVNDDLLDDSILDIPENSDEKRNPRREDRYLAAKLIEHLNSNLEYYNKVLWFSLDPDRRYMLLDGFSIQTFDDNGKPIAAPGGLRSLASVVKNDVIAVAGNSLVFPVAPGYRVSGSFIHERTDGTEDEVTLFDHYKTPLEPYLVSVPSKGVFAEAVQGACNACEKIETERLQDWNRYPISDEPTPIAPVTTPTPVATDWRAAFKDFATPMINIQNAPATPEPGAGLAGLSDLLGKSGVFKDITGLDANQQNAIRTYLSNQENAKAFGEMAKEMAMQQHNTQNTGKIMDTLKTAKDSGALNQEDYSKLVKDHLQQQIDGGTTKNAQLEKDKLSTSTPLTKAAVDAAAEGRSVKAQTTDSGNNMESVDISEPGGGGPGGILQNIMGAIPIVKKAQATMTDPGWRACCALGQWKLGLSGALDPTKLGGHQKGGVRPGGPTGYVYTQCVGLIDVGHIRDLADSTKFIFDAFLNGATLLDLYEGTASVFALPPDQESTLALAGAIAFVESWAHELTTWPDESSFSPEDICSNIIGIECAKRAIPMGGSFNAAMDTVLDIMVNSELKAVPRADTATVLAKIENDWFSVKLVPPTITLLRRNFDGSPWMANMAFDAPVSIPWLNPAAFDSLYSEFSYKIRGTVNGKAGVTMLTMKAATADLRAAFTAANPGRDKP